MRNGDETDCQKRPDRRDKASKTGCRRQLKEIEKISDEQNNGRRKIHAPMPATGTLRADGGEAEPNGGRSDNAPWKNYR